MRFKAKLAHQQLDLLYSLVGPISRLTSQAVLYLDKEHVRLSTRDNGGDGIACYAELSTVSGLFLEMRIESADENRIAFEIDLVQWRTALQSVLGGDTSSRKRKADNADFENEMHVGSTETSTTIMKLAKRYGGQPCLCLDSSCAGGSVDVHHAIPIRVMRSKDMQYHLPPKINLPSVQLELSIERPLRTVVERLKSISQAVYLEGSMAGELTLRIESDGAAIRTFFSQLAPHFEDCKGENDPSQHCTLKVDTKKLAACLQWQGSSMVRTISHALLCMVENEMLVLHVLLHPENVGFFTYYIPVYFLNEDPTLE